MFVSRSSSPQCLLIELENQAIPTSGGISSITMRNIQNCSELPLSAPSSSLYTQAELQVADALLRMSSVQSTSPEPTKDSTTKELIHFSHLSSRAQNQIKEYICNLLIADMTYENIHTHIMAKCYVSISVSTICRIAKQKGFKAVREKKIEKLKKEVFEMKRDSTQTIKTIATSLGLAPKTVRKWLKHQALSSTKQ